MADATQGLSERENRIRKLEAIREAGIDPYPTNYTPTHTSCDIKENFDAMEGATVRVAGRMMLKRVMGKASFATIKDGAGRIQLYVQRDEIGTERYNTVFKKLIDIGDIIGVEGTVFKTQKGEISVHATSLDVLSKSLVPLPEKFHGLTDTELRYRQRYVDLIMNDEVKKDFITRSKVIAEIRAFLTGEGFLEVETPMMQSIPGGAKARPFITHHNALDMELYLRIAPELYLKRLVVGGMERVFELNRNFRNEGISTRHNPEFTMLEVYQAYADYEDMMRLTENLFASICDTVMGTREISYQGETLSFEPPFSRMTMIEAVAKYADVDFTTIATAEDARAAAKAKGVDVDDMMTKWQTLAFLFEEKVEEHLIQPTFITDFPLEISPLSKKKPDDGEFVERFEVFIAGRELANAFSELNDPVDQKERFEAQVAQKEAGDEEAMFMDLDYVNALEHGMPPTGGLGIGIDRLVMLFVDTASIRDTILFPQMRKS